jgi:hypothetical protein
MTLIRANYLRGISDALLLDKQQQSAAYPAVPSWGGLNLQCN